MFKVNNENTKMTYCYFEQVNASWACTIYQAMAVDALKQ